MSRTIVQEYGPIYGEPVNGTVQGRPNGSVFVPLTNKIQIAIDYEYVKVWTASWGTDYYAVCQSDGTRTGAYHVVAESQDLSSNMVVSLYSDSALTTRVAKYSFTAGIFNGAQNVVTLTDSTPQVGDTLYLVATLENNGTPVATSSAIPVELVA